MENKMKYVMSSVLGVSPEEINQDSSPETIPSWDSLKQMDLITVVEEEFDIELSDEQVIQVLDYKSLRKVLQESYQSR